MVCIIKLYAEVTVVFGGFVWKTHQSLHAWLFCLSCTFPETITLLLLKEDKGK